MNRLDPSQVSTAVVRLVGVPVALWKRTALHHEALNREFEIIRAGLAEDEPPNRVLRLVGDLEARFGDLSGGNREDLEAVFQRGQESVDLAYTVPLAAAGLIAQLSESLDAVDEFCAERQELLSSTSTAEMVRFRHWFLGEFTRQIEQGHPPSPWPGDSVRPVVHFDGELDISSAEELRRAINRQRLATDGDITVDLSGLTFVDSVGLSLLVMAQASFEEEERTMRIVLPDALRPLIELSGLLEVLEPEFV